MEGAGGRREGGEGLRLERGRTGSLLSKHIGDRLPFGTCRNAYSARANRASDSANHDLRPGASDTGYWTTRRKFRFETATVHLPAIRHAETHIYDTAAVLALPLEPCSQGRVLFAREALCLP